MIAAIHQPSYFPWLGLLDKINKSDTFVLLDNVQLSDSAYQHRNVFLDNQGVEHILTIPISKKNYADKMIKDIEISNNIWQKKHDKFIYFNYKKHPFFDEIYPIIKPVYEKKYKFLVDVLTDSMLSTFNLFNIETKLIIGSKLPLEKSLKKEGLVLDILKEIKANEYLSGRGAEAYQKNENFKKNDIILNYQEFKHPVYEQYKIKDFKEGIASLDMLFNLGREKSALLLATL